MHDHSALKDSKSIRTLKFTLFTICRSIAGFQLKIKKIFPSKNKNILFAGTSEVTVDFLLTINGVMSELVENKASYLLVSKGCREFAQASLSRYQEEMTLISIIRALCTPWDIIIFSDHNNTRWFHPSIPKIQCTHGIDAATVLGHLGSGGNYLYGKNTLDQEGNLLYDLMFVESVYNRDLFTHSNPALKGKTAVVGNLRADELLGMNQNREKIRQDLGLQEEDKMLLICSTWGSKSLIQRFGNTLLDEIPSVSETYKVYFLIHPLNDRTEFPEHGTISEIMRTYKRKGIARRIDPLVSPLPYLVAADIVLTDHTSSFLYYALLEKPFLFVPIIENLMDGSLVWKFYKLREKYNPDLPLGNQLDCAIKNFPAEQHKKQAKLLVDERGHARQRIRDEIARFL